MRWALLSAVGGIWAGMAATVFLVLLEQVTTFRSSHPLIIWLLPLAGLTIGLAYHYLGTSVAAGSNLIIDEIHNPKNTVPFRMVPLVLIGTLLTHLCGGSAGREGTIVQIGATLADQLTKLFTIEPQERKILLVAGAGAGFGAAIGTPWAGVIFGMEVISIGRLQVFALFECFIASFMGFYTTHFLGAPHSTFLKFELPALDPKTVFFVTLAGLCFGLCSRVFIKVTHFVEAIFRRTVSYAPLRPFIGGMLLVFLYQLEGSYRFVGLGIEGITEALSSVSSLEVPLLKGFFSALTVGSGFKGGEFVPLVFIGTSLGSALALLLPVSFKLLAALGFVAVFAGAANTPVACTIMAMEVFGYQIGGYAFIACFVSYFCSGSSGIYKSQPVVLSKQQQLFLKLEWLARPWRSLKR